MKRVFLIIFLSFMVIGVDDVYGAKSKSKRPTASKVKRKKPSPPPKKVEKKKTLERSTTKSIIKKKDTKSKDTKSAPTLNSSQKSAVDKKLAKHKALQGKTFKNKKEAETAYRSSLKNQTYSKKPDTRPDHVPASYDYNGRQVETIFVGDRYGFYSSPGVFRPYGANDFLVDALILTALTTPRTSTTPVVVDRKPTNESDVKIVLIIIGFIAILIICGGAVYVLSQKKGS